LGPHPARNHATPRDSDSQLTVGFMSIRHPMYHARGMPSQQR
jgi:hypothetical protein